MNFSRRKATGAEFSAVHVLRTADTAQVHFTIVAGIHLQVCAKSIILSAKKSIRFNFSVLFEDNACALNSSHWDRDVKPILCQSSPWTHAYTNLVCLHGFTVHYDTFHALQITAVLHACIYSFCCTDPQFSTIGNCC